MPARRSPAPKAGETEITIRLSHNLFGRIDGWIGSQNKTVSRQDKEQSYRNSIATH
jgi:hypothetical protein